MSDQHADYSGTASWHRRPPNAQQNSQSQTAQPVAIPRLVSEDPERGFTNRPSRASLPRASLASSHHTAEDEAQQQQLQQIPWGPSHPCFPHLNPHVPTSSPLYQRTRVIRIQRDWLKTGDVSPQFSNLYSEILGPAGLPMKNFDA